MLDYDREADIYDETRGGVVRALAAAEAVDGLLPAGVSTVLDVAGGTGIVGECLARQGRRVIVVDRSYGMLRHARRRLGAVAQADGTRLPIRTGSVDAVAMIWLLHLVPDALPFVVEAARVLRPGGVLVTTVDKDGRRLGAATDSRHRVEDLARHCGLEPYGETTFVGHGRPGTPTYTLVAFASPSSPVE